MRYDLTPDQPKHLDQIRVGNTSDARWRSQPKRPRILTVNSLDVHEDELRISRRQSERQRDLKYKAARKAKRS